MHPCWLPPSETDNAEGIKEVANTTTSTFSHFYPEVWKFCGIYGIKNFESKLERKGFHIASVPYFNRLQVILTAFIPFSTHHLPTNGLDTILTVVFKDDVQSREATTYPFMKGHFKNWFTPFLKTNTFWKFPWGAGENSRGWAGGRAGTWSPWGGECWTQPGHREASGESGSPVSWERVLETTHQLAALWTKPAMAPLVPICTGCKACFSTEAHL